MHERIADGIVEAAESDGMSLRLQTDYSGRGMYGAKTAAIVCNNFGDFTAGVARFCGELNPGQEYDIIEEVVLACQNIRQDSMGRGIVLY